MPKRRGLQVVKSVCCKVQELIRLWKSDVSFIISLHLRSVKSNYHSAESINVATWKSSII
jgi:hypothetical protein